MKKAKKKIIFIGQRYYPSEHYGSSGVEYYVEQKVRLLMDKNDVTCVTSDARQQKRKGVVHVVYIPSVSFNYSDTPIRAFLATWYAVFAHVDEVWYQGCQSGFFIPILRIFGITTVLVVHSDEYKKAKWGKFSQAILKITEYVAVSHATRILSVSRRTKNRIERMYHTQCALEPIPFHTKKYHLTPADLPDVGSKPYILFLGRLVPEKRVHWLISAFQETALSKTYTLVIAGGESHSEAYAASLMHLSRDNACIRFLPYQIGKAKFALLKYCSLFVLPSEVEGYPVTLLEATDVGARCLIPKFLAEEKFSLFSKIRYFQSERYSDFKRALLAAASKFR